MIALKNTDFKFFYIDAFAGAGIVEVRGSIPSKESDGADALIPEAFAPEDSKELKEFIQGSPLRALNLERKFDCYRFVDLDPTRVADLEALAAKFDTVDVKVFNGEANERVQFIARNFTKPHWRGVAFLDPYGAHLHWKTLEALAATQKFDVIINFPLGMTINRLVMRDPSEIPVSWKKQLDLCFGTQEWQDIAFSKTDDLFGEEVTSKHVDASERLLRLYLDRLEAIFGYVAVPSLVRNTKGSPLYYLLWASSNPRGKKIADHILGLGEKVVFRKTK